MAAREQAEGPPSSTLCPSGLLLLLLCARPHPSADQGPTHEGTAAGVVVPHPPLLVWIEIMG